MLHTVLSERFAMANTIKFANEEIEKVKAIAEVKGQALREKENQFQEMTRIVQELHRNLSDVQNNNPSLLGNASFTKVLGDINNQVISKFSLSISEPTKVLGEVEGSGSDANRLLSYIRERDAENQTLKQRLIEVEKSSIAKEYSGVNSERTLQALRAENSDLARQIDQLKTKASQSGSSDDLKLKTANARIQELESQLRTSELQLRQVKDTTSSAATSRVNQTQSNMVESQYSSSSSRYGSSTSGTTGAYGSTSGTGATGNTTSTTNYQSSYTNAGNTGLSSSGAYKGTGLSGSNASGSGSGYGTSGVTSSNTYGSGSRTYGSSATGAAGTTGASGTVSGTASGSSTYGQSRTGATTSTYGQGATTSTYGQGATGSSSYGQSSSSYSSSYQSGTSSTLKQSGTGASGSTYSFQTKKY